MARLEDVEFATLDWVWWFNHHLLEPLGYLPRRSLRRSSIARRRRTTLTSPRQYLT